MYVYQGRATGRPHVTLVTSGLSDYRLQTEYPPPEWFCERAELIMYLPDLGLSPGQTEFPWQVEFLRKVSRAPAKTDFRPAAFMALPNGMPPEPFSQSSNLTHAALLPPWHEPTALRDGFDAPDGTSVEFLWLDFITSAEAEYLEQRGPAAFLALLQSRDHGPPTRLFRDCYASDVEGLVVPTKWDDNRVRQLETCVLEGIDGPAYVIKLAIDVEDAGTADSFVAGLVKKVAVQRMGSPPDTAALVVTIVGDLSAHAFAELWRKHLATSPPMTFFMSRMAHAEVIQGTRTGEKLDECSLVEASARQ